MRRGRTIWSGLFCPRLRPGAGWSVTVSRIPAASTKALAGTPESLIEALDDAVVNGDQPDLTLVFDLPVEVGLDRAFGRGLFETRFESKGLAFHQKLRDGFLQVAERHPERCVVLDATGEVDDVSARLWAVVEERLL